MSEPVRIQLRRTKGWRMPANTVKVTRGPGMKFGNPYVHEDPAIAVAAYRGLLTGDLSYVPGLQLARGQLGFGRERADALRLALPELRGKNLACFCPLDQPCHADVLLELANATQPSSTERRS